LGITLLFNKVLTDFHVFNYRVNTSYVTVEPKRRKQVPQHDEETASTEQGSPQSGDSQQQSKAATPPKEKPAAETTAQHPQTPPVSTEAGPSRQSGSRGSSGRELRRARIVITVKRTESYKQWLVENPMQAIIGGGETESEAAGSQSQRAPK